MKSADCPNCKNRDLGFNERLRAHVFWLHCRICNRHWKIASVKLTFYLYLFALVQTFLLFGALHFLDLLSIGSETAVILFAILSVIFVPPYFVRAPYSIRYSDGVPLKATIAFTVFFIIWLLIQLVRD